MVLVIYQLLNDNHDNANTNIVLVQKNMAVQLFLCEISLFSNTCFCVSGHVEACACGVTENLLERSTEDMECMGIQALFIGSSSSII